jgi:phytoene dehydrogenase-like protein
MAGEVVIIGAGPNGLVAAFCLAREGLRPAVLERRESVGGAATTEEFHRGFKCSALAHRASLSETIAREMQLARHGLEMLHPRAAVFVPARDGPGLLLSTDPAETRRQIEKFSARDATRFAELEAALAGLAPFLRGLLTMTPPAFARPASRDWWQLLRAGRSFRRLGKKQMLRLLRWAPMPVADFAEEWFETELLRAVVAARAIFGSAAGPFSPGTTTRLLLESAASACGPKPSGARPQPEPFGGRWPGPAGSVTFPRGGMGALSEAMAQAARAAGATIRTGAEVARVLVKDGAVVGVALASGEELPARAVISSADPKRTFLRLVDPVELAPEFLLKMQNYRASGVVAKVNLALDRLPNFSALVAAGDGAADTLAGRIQIGPSLEYLERAFDDSKYGEISRAPFLDAMIPSLSDPTLAPAGKHVMSVVAQYAPYRLKSGYWGQERDRLADRVIATLAEYAPGFHETIIARQVITPKDLEKTYALTGGHIFHGELSLDQLFTMRPLLGWAQYRTPLRGLYLCGSGTHPGLGPSGLSGYNAARDILKELK